MKQVALRVLKTIDVRDLHCYGGLALVGVGCWIYAPGASLIVVGAALFYLALRRV